MEPWELAGALCPTLDPLDCSLPFRPLGDLCSGKNPVELTVAMHDRIISLIMPRQEDYKVEATLDCII